MARSLIGLFGVLLLFGACGGSTTPDNAAGHGGSGGVDAGQGGSGGVDVGQGGSGAGGAVSCKQFLGGTCAGANVNQMGAFDHCMPQCTSDAECAAGFICVRQRCRQSCTAAPSPVYQGSAGGLNDAGNGYLAYCGLSGDGCPGEQVCVRELKGSQRLYCACADGQCANGNACSGYCNL